MRPLTHLLVALLMTASATAQAAEQALPREVSINNVEFVLIPGGTVAFPAPHQDPATSQPIGTGVREVQLVTRPYYLAKYEARARDFLRFMTEGQPRHAVQYEKPPTGVAGAGAEEGCGVRKSAKGYYLVDPSRDLPATHLSWDLANEFAQWMGFRLPTEAEWVRAFRGDDKRTFPWGDTFPDDTFAAFQEGATECNVQPVTAYEKGRSPFGIQNMAGNVFEYVADWYSPTHYNSLKDGQLASVAAAPFDLPETGPMRMLRGGRWASGPQELSIKGANRDLRRTDSPFICYGARFAIDAEAVRKQLATGAAKAL